MFKGFNLDLNWSPEYDDQFYKFGKELFLDYERQVKDIFDNNILKESAIDGSLMQENWFPQIEADIFISHSHKDEKSAIAFAGWLYNTFGIKSFIDSCIWGYSNDLLKIIDDEYCYQARSGTYNYQKRNYSTSHVHMMLSVALTMMIDNTESIFFLNTPNSISTSSVVSKTESPWIYSEIAMTRMIAKKIPERKKSRVTEYFEKGGKLNERLQIEYYADLSHLINIDVDTLNNWMKGFQKSTAKNALDKLYVITEVSSDLEQLFG